MWKVFCIIGSWAAQKPCQVLPFAHLQSITLPLSPTSGIVRAERSGKADMPDLIHCRLAKVGGMPSTELNASHIPKGEGK